jgi:plastocyanin
MLQGLLSPRLLIRACLALLAFGTWSAAALSAGALAVTVRLANDKPLPGAVITARPLDAAARPAAPLKAIMDQVDLAFAPDVLVIPVGSTVEFPNTDATSHEVYSFSSTHKFQLPLYRGKRYPPEHFDQVGLVTLGCNIHDHMLAYILVTDAPYFGRTGNDGVWAATGVAPGRYRIEVWHPRLRGDPAEFSREVSVGESQSGELSIRLTKALRPAPLEGRPHSWDAY